MLALEVHSRLIAAGFITGEAFAALLLQPQPPLQRLRGMHSKRAILFALALDECSLFTLSNEPLIHCELHAASIGEATPWLWLKGFRKQTVKGRIDAR